MKKNQKSTLTFSVVRKSGKTQKQLPEYERDDENKNHTGQNLKEDVTNATMEINQN